MRSTRRASPLVRSLAAIRAWPPLLVAVTIAALVSLVVVLEVGTGRDITVAQLFLVPILLAAVRSRRLGLFAAVGANLIGFAFDVWRLGEATSIFVPIWNWTIRGVSAVVFAWLTTEVLMAFEQERLDARTDPLTGAVNRLAFYERLGHAVEVARRPGRCLALAYVDLDRFKSVNDQAGHEEGDRVLRAVVDTIGARLREGDAVFRLGGDEFAFVLVDADAEQALAISERILAAWADRVARERWPVGLSIGIATLREGTTVDALIEEADRTMYRAKREGGGRVLLAEPPPPSPA